MVRIAVDNWNLSSCNIVAAGAVEARQSPAICKARLMPRQILHSATRLFEFSITYKARPENPSAFWEKHTMRKCIACPSTGWSGDRRADLVPTSYPLVLL